VPFAFVGIVGRRIWQLRRRPQRPELPAESGREDPPA
jgi:hypothetical protein